MCRFSKIFCLGVTLVFMLALSGCLVRTYTVEKPRVDTQVTGNQGYLAGKPSDKPEENKLGSTRKITVLEVEVGPKSNGEAKEPYIEKKEKAAKEISEDIILEEPESVTERYKMRKVYQETPEKKPAGDYKAYKVQKNDTLQKISKKFYDTTRRWQKIFEVNRDVLESPDDIFPGQTLKIPLN